MSKITPLTHSFLEWQQAAGTLLSLQTALSRSKRAVPDAEIPGDAALEAMVAWQRTIADGLFRVAFAEANEPGDGPRPTASFPAGFGRRR